MRAFSAVPDMGLDPGLDADPRLESLGCFQKSLRDTPKSEMLSNRQGRAGTSLSKYEVMAQIGRRTQPMKELLINLVALLASCSLWAQTNVDFKRAEDIIYGRKFGTALTLDAFEPAKLNGAGIILMVSGGLFSSHDSINPGYFRAFLEHGYTVFAVVHGSQPKFVFTEVQPDMHRPLRFIP